MQKLLAVSTMSLALFAANSQAAPIVTLSAPGETTTSVAGATLIDFNNGCGYASCTGAFQIVLGSLSGQYAQPAGTNTPYLSVPNPVSSGTATLGLGVLANYFGLYWGSIDSYNSIAFSNGANVIASYSGTDLVGAFANGDQLNYASNRFINFDFGEDLFDTVLLTSTSYAFETDNHAFALPNILSRASVPEPGSQLLLLGGLIALFGIRKHLTKSR
jgi:hypothetical protein